MQELRRQLGLKDAVVVGLGAMIGAGVFAAFAPAAEVAGSGLLIGLALAAVVAYCNATSSARLAARYPESGGTYVYGRERLGPFWGYLAGWAFVVGKTASCAAMALTVGSYLWPDQAHPVAVAAVVALTALNYFGVQKAAWLTRIIVTVVLIVLAVVVVVCLTADRAQVSRLEIGGDASFRGVLQAAGLLFFAFAGYARIATLGEEVRDPARTIPRAIPIALGIALLVYAAVAALGSLLALILGVSRTTLAMARDRHLPHALAAVHPRFKSPHRAEVVVGVVVAVVAALVDVRGAIGFSSFAVLLYYAIANASAFTLGRRVIPSIGFVSCLLLAFLLPVSSVLVGAAVVAIGAAAYVVSAPGRPASGS